MSQYHAPLAEMQFVMNELAGLGELCRLPGFEEATPETVGAILEEAGSNDLIAIGGRLRTGLDALEDAARPIVERYAGDTRSALAGAGPFLELAGIVCGGAMLARSALIAARKLGESDGAPQFLRAKIVTARFFADHCLTQASGLRDAVVAGAASVLALADEQF